MILLMEDILHPKKSLNISHYLWGYPGPHPFFLDITVALASPIFGSTKVAAHCHWMGALTVELEEGCLGGPGD